MVRRVLWDNKFPETSLGTRAGTRVAAAPGPASSAAGLLGESQVNSSFPHKQGLSSTRSTWMLQVAWGNQDEVANTGGCMHPHRLCR